MLPNDLKWERAPMTWRRQVFEAYRLRADFPTGLTFEQADSCWTGSWFVLVRYTFCPTCYWDDHKLAGV